MRFCESALSVSFLFAKADPALGISIEHLRDLKAFFGTTFKIKAAPPPPSLSDDVEGGETEEGALEGPKAPKAEEYILSCVGTGFTNTAKRT